MKSILFLLITAASFSAQAKLESFYGRVSNYGFRYTCTYQNDTGAAQNMKYVIFSFDRLSGENPEFEVQERIDKVVSPGEVIQHSVREPLAHIARHCRYLAR